MSNELTFLIFGILLIGFAVFMAFLVWWQEKQSH